MAQQATLINSAGKKVVVDTGSQQAKDYFAQGYSLMGSTAASKPAAPAASTPSAPTAGYSSSDPAVQKQLADMQKQVQALSSKASSSYSPPSPPSSLSAPSAPASTQSQASPQGQTSLASSGNSNVPAGLVKVDGVSRGAGGSSSVNAYTQDPNFDEKYEDMQWIGNDLYARKIPLATLISPTGQRVVARTDSVSSGKYKPAADYFAQGYVLEKTPGVYTDSSGKSTAFGAQMMEPAKAKAYDASKTQPVASSSGPGAGFSLPSGYTAISGALYPDRASQLANFSDIQMYGKVGEPGSFLYGKPKDSQKDGSGSEGQQGSAGSASKAATPAAPDLPFDVLSFLQQNVVSPEDAAKAFQYYSPDSSNADKAAALERLYGESRKAILDRQAQLKALEEEVLKSMSVSDEEAETQRLLDEIVAQQRNISSSEELGINEIKKQPIAMAFLSGQSAAVQRDAASKINALASQSEPLRAQLAQAQAKRQAAADVAKTKYSFAEKQYEEFLNQTKPMEVGGNIVRFNPITQTFETVYEGPSEDSKPVSVSSGGTLVDPKTGRVIYQSPKEIDYQIVTNPITGEVYRIPKNGPEGTVAGGSTGIAVGNSPGVLGNDVIGVLASQALQNPGVLETLSSEQKRAVIARLAATGQQIPTSTKPSTDAERTSAGFANRVRESEAVFAQNAQNIASLPIAQFYAYQNAPNLAKPAWFQQQEQAQRNFVNAVLRRESGAVISPSEFENASQQYFPQPGDSAAVLQQKTANRQTALQNLILSAGSAYSQPSASTLSAKYGVPQGEVQQLIDTGYQMDQIETILQAYSQQLPKKAQAPSAQAEGASWNLGTTAPTAGAPGDVSRIMAAIRTIESNSNYSAKGGSGEYGAYQFMPGTWKSWAQKYLGDGNAAMSKENQDYVAERRISDLVSQGYNPYQIALIWNGGSPTVKKGTNKFGVAYDSGAYADKVLAQFNASAPTYAYAS